MERERVSLRDVFLTGRSSAARLTQGLKRNRSCSVLLLLSVSLFCFHSVALPLWCFLIGRCLHSGTFSLLVSEDHTLHGPVFVQEPSHVMFPLDAEEKKVKLTCDVAGNPKPHIRCVGLHACVATWFLPLSQQTLIT